MSYIPPNGNIWLLHNVPIDKTYQNTLYWPHYPVETGKAAQRNYFLGQSNNFVKYSFTNQYYTRHERGSIRVAVVADNILDCNYLVFQNASFGIEKLFYAFITSVEYVNHTTAQVNFEIDVIQTWYFDFTLVSCFIERTHAISDALYENLAPEPAQPGEMVYETIKKSSWTLPLYTIMAVVDVNEGASQGNLYSNVYSGTTLYAFQPDDVDGINAKISQYITSPDSIVSLYMVPQVLITKTIPTTSDMSNPGTVLTKNDIRLGIRQLASTDLPDPTQLLTFGSYTPHNKKLYTYPFTQLEVFTPTGAAATYRYEFFEDHMPAFAYGGTVTIPVELTLVPLFYKNYDNGATSEPPLFSESVTLSGYPLCSWNTDAYKAWCAQNAVSIYTGVAGFGFTLLRAATDPLGALSEGFDRAAAGINDFYQASIAADRLAGTAKGSASVGMDVLTFYFGHKVVNEDTARRIDSFFDRFGYAVNKIQVPQQKTRTFYTYLKTSGCSIHGSVPADDEDKICKIHDSGVTYWDAANATPDIVGDFSVASRNLPIGGGG